MADSEAHESRGFLWKFQRMGGLDQVTLRTAEELRHLSELDPKLWVILSCPATGLESDARTLALIDSDHDGRIRIPEVVAAVEWVCARLANPADLAGQDGELPSAMPLAAINVATEEGRRLEATVRGILTRQGKPGADSVTQRDVEAAVATAARNTYNGDGIFPPLDDLGDEIRDFVRDALAVMGGVSDASGQPGIGRPQAEAFLKALAEWRAWRQTVDEAPHPLGADTESAWALLSRLKEKIDDYFLRVRYASYAPDSIAALNMEDAIPAKMGLLEPSGLTGLPLAHVEAGGRDAPLRAQCGFNPAWADDMRRFFEVANPLLPVPDTLSRDDWRELQARFEPYASALAGKPVIEPAEDQSAAPTASIDDLGRARVDELLTGRAAALFEEAVARDVAASTAADDIAEAERLVLYYLHLHRLLMNFVSLYDFYSLRRSATFQVGTLFMDGRGCRLCLPVSDVARHSTMAVFSRLCLLYCHCTRVSRPGGTEPDQSMTIVAAMTAGDDSLLIEGRNGVFVDNQGQDWDATLIKVVQNPVSLRQAVWAPYKRVGRMVTEQLEKLANAKNDALLSNAGARIETLTTAPGATPEAKKSFDIGKSVGIFAAIGLALGAIGTALASLGRTLAALHWWQYPLLVLGAFVLISGPSVFLAWLKLRGRTLGPVLEASGWAVNSRVPVNLMLGRALTSLARLPANAQRSIIDPLRKPSGLRLAALAGLILAVAIAAGAGLGWWCLNRGPQSAPEVAPQVLERSADDAARGAPAEARQDLGGEQQEESASSPAAASAP
ncbi:MAG: ABC transporter permease [Desulfovibrionaceae bacterium]|nr:ABC transporter permease [Desulfovibrionaceae bacterium]